MRKNTPSRSSHFVRTFRRLSPVSFLFAIGILIFSQSQNALAHPVFYADGWGLMTWSSPRMTEGYFARTLTHRFALGLRYFGVREASEPPFTQYLLGGASVLLKRWNAPASQGNIYLSLAPGAVIQSKESGHHAEGALYSAVEADWENRRIYTLAKVWSLQSKPSDTDPQIDRGKWMLRAGFSPYLAEFTELNTWLILEASSSIVGAPNSDLTPLVRLFYNNFLMEIGVSLRGMTQLNLMTHF